MYTPSHFREDRIEVMGELMRRHPLAALVTIGPDGMDANHVPLIYDPEPAPFGTLVGHLAKANRQWRSWRPDLGALAIFQGPQAYISPSLYPSKAEHGQVVPTWNYAVVHAHASLTIHEDPEWLLALVTRLTETHEAARATPWRVSDAPPGYVDNLLRGIVGIELHIHKLEGKWKVSQNRDQTDRAGVLSWLEAAAGHPAEEMAALIRERPDNPLN